MSIFATEFAVSAEIDKAGFTAEVIAWLRGMEGSEILSVSTDKDLDADNPVLQTPSGEELRMLVLSGEGDDAGTMQAIGFSHRTPDQEGRYWQTQAVLRRSGGSHAILRMQSQCIATDPLAHLPTPRKPYFIKTILTEGWACADGLLDIRQEPFHLEDSRDGLELARAITEGAATDRLPVIYVSANDRSLPELTETDLEKMAYDLGGIAHVVVEPDRAFSFQLADMVERGNVYGGALGLIIPGKGVTRRLLKGWAFPDSKALAREATRLARTMRTSMPSRDGWSWTRLQEAYTRALRKRERSRVSHEEYEQLWQEELEAKDARIRELEQALANASDTTISPASSEGILDDNFVSALGPEIYEGEFSDRVRTALEQVAKTGKNQGWDTRSLWLFEQILSISEPSGRARALLSEIRRATRDNKRSARELPRLLEKYGYQPPTESKHGRQHPKAGYQGLGILTIAKTPSDHRAADNLVRQVKDALGLKRLT